MWLPDARKWLGWLGLVRVGFFKGNQRGGVYYDGFRLVVGVVRVAARAGVYVRVLMR